MSYLRNGYLIITTSSRKNQQREHQSRYVPRRYSNSSTWGATSPHKQIRGIGHRVLKVILTSKNANAPINPSNLSAQMGYTVDERKQHWNIAQDKIKQIPTTNLRIWCADANGKLCNRSRTDPNVNKIIGTNTIARTTERGKGKRLQDICTKYSLVPMTTWRRQPRQTKHEPEDISTCVHPCAATKRQIDYISVSRKYRNCVRK